MALLDLLGRRWVLRILWELRGEPLGFRELQVVCDGMSPSVLSGRLHELRDTGIIQQDGRGNYALSSHGRELLHALAPLQHWADEWVTRLGKPGPVPHFDADPV